jgi:hypothetical protein
MAVAEEQREDEQEQEQDREQGQSGSGAKSALTSAAVAAATGAAVYGVRKALTKNGNGSSAVSKLDPRRGRNDSDDDDENGDDEDGGGESKRSSLVSSAASSAWDSASHALLPMAEDAAEAAGKWVAENAPDVVKERILPRFIESFNDAV